MFTKLRTRTAGLTTAGIVTAAAFTAALPAPVAVAADLVVNTAADNETVDGLCSLREAMNYANGAAGADCALPNGASPTVVTFADSYTIYVASPLPVITGDLVLNGDGQRVFGGDLDSVFRVAVGASLSIDRMVVTDGTATQGGGIFNQGELTVTNSLIRGNAATGYGGGGIYTEGPTSIINSTITGNSAGANGGGLLNENGETKIAFSTITDNTAPNGAGIASYGNTGGGTVTLVGASIVASNHTGNDVDLIDDTTNTFLSDGFNVIGSIGADVGSFGLAPGGSTDATGADPLLASLPFTPDHTATHAPNAGSPAIDRVTADLLLLSNPALDQRGVSRPQGVAKDAGAHEACGPSPWSAGTEPELRSAVTCFNETDSLDEQVIEITDDITLTEMTPFIAGTGASPLLTLNGNGHTLDGNSITTVLDISSNGGDYDVDVNDLNITNGLSRGINFDTNLLTITNTTITNTSGHGIFADSSDVAIVDSVISDNTRTGVTAYLGTIDVTRSTISGNGKGGVKGAGDLGLGNAKLVTITDSSITGNSSFSGGGVNAEGALTVVGSTIDGNDAVHGGGIHVQGILTVRSSTIADNEAEKNGAGVYIGGPDAWIDSSTIDGNTVNLTGPDPLGGGIAVMASGAVVTKSSITGNTASNGAGINVQGSVDIIDSTISGNTADTFGGGIFVNGETKIVHSTITNNNGPQGAGIALTDASTRLAASIVAGNTGPDGDLYSTTGTAISNGYNVIGSTGATGTDPGTAFVETGDVTGVTDPQLDALADNGGPTETHRPQAGSIVLDRVTSAVADASATDQRGEPRPSGTASDSGSVERQDADGDDVLDGVDNCPDDANADQADADGDGVGDVCDPTPDPIDPEVFTSLDPARFADSRDETTFDGQFLNTGQRASDSTWEIDIAGRGDVPTDAAAVIVNLTVLNGTGPGFATAYPCGDLPNASSVNYSAGTVEPNEVIAKLSSSGTLCVYTLTQADVIVDVVGYVSNTSPYEPITPTRYADSRNEDTFDDQFRDTGIRQSGTTWEIDIAGRGTIPATATTVVANITITAGTGPGFATIYPCTDDVPNASSLNYDIGVTIPNEVVTKLSDTGTLCVYTLTNAHVIVDIVGYLEPTTAFTPIVPTRYADSRNENTFDNTFNNTGIRPSDTVWEIDIAGRGTIPTNATTAVANITVTDTTGPGFATVYPCTNEPPNASSINYGLNTTRPNEVITKLSPTGTICIYTLTATHLIIDITGHNGT